MVTWHEDTRIPLGRSESVSKPAKWFGLARLLPSRNRRLTRRINRDSLARADVARTMRNPN